MTRPLLLTVLCLIVSTLTGFGEEEKPTAAYVLGQTDARRDLAAGKLGIETFGFLRIEHADFRSILKERYGIETHVVAGCIVNSTITGHASGYNAIMNAEIEKRFGKNLFERVWKEIEDARKKENP